MIRLQDIRLRPKLTGLFLLGGLIPVVLFWWLQAHQTDRTGHLQASARLESARQVALSEIKRHIAERRADMEILAQIAAEQHQQARASLESLRDLKKERVETFLANPLNDMVQLAANPDFVKRVAAIDWLFRQGGRKAEDKQWRETVEGFIPPLHGRQSGPGTEELFFISPLGDVVYGLNKPAELGQNLHQKPLKESPLASFHRQAMERPLIQEFPAGGSAENTPFVYFGAPVKKDGATIGTVITRLSRSQLTQLLRAGVDPASHGELYLAGADGLRTELPASRTPATLPGSVIKSGVEGKSGSRLISLPNQPPTLVAWAPIQIQEIRWTIVVEKEAARIFAPQRGQTRNWLQKFSETAGYYDLFLIHPDGNVFHTAARQADFATNLLTGRFATTNLGQLIQKVLKSKQPGMSDLLPYPPSDNQPAFFMAQPVLDNGQVVLVAALQLAPDAITSMLHQLSQSNPYRIFLVGPDEGLRSDAFTDPANPSTATAFIGGPATATVAPVAIRNALAGESGTEETTRTDGKRVLSSYAPLPMDGFSWAVIAELDLEESTPDNTRLLLLGVLLCVALLTLFAARILNRDLLKPLSDTAFTLNRMASGHFTPHETITRRDEIGTLARSVVTVSEEVAQAGQRIHQAADPMALRIRRLASLAMVISRESSAGSETLAEARKTIEESARLFAEESNRLLQEQSRLVAEQTLRLHDTERMAGLTAQAITEGKQVVNDSVALWQHLLGRLQRFQESTQELAQSASTPPKSSDEGGKGSKHHGKHGHHGKESAGQPPEMSRLTQEMQAELDELTRLVQDRLSASEGTLTTLDTLLPAIPMPQRPEANPLVTLEHTPDRTLMALDKLDDLLKKNVATAREIILAAKAVFDITTGPLKQATSYFATQDAALPDSLSNRPAVGVPEMERREQPPSQLSTHPSRTPGAQGIESSDTV
ncbi:MAG: methyl-accepting chemotaxis protein [Magnetococcales bacterium]|nr:methyl-accepting chemotaxis protein [Magnetococcales bacterium]